MQRRLFAGALVVALCAAVACVRTDDLAGTPDADAPDAAADTASPPPPPPEGDAGPSDAGGDVDADAADPFAADLVGYWPLDEGTGTVAHDATGNANHASLKGGPQWVAGHRGSALRFDGTQSMEVLTLANTAFPQSGTFSVWFSAPLADNVSRSILDNYDPSRAHLYARQVGPAGTKLEFSGQANDAGAFSMSFAVTPNKYTHLVVTWDSPARAMKAYVDGALVGTDTTPSGWTPSDQRFLVSAPGCCGAWIGDLDELRLYRRALTVQEIQLVP